MSDKIIVIGSWTDSASRLLRLQDFTSNGESFIPIFSDEVSFKIQIEGTEFESSGLAIDRDLLVAILTGEELLILDPGGPNPVRLNKASLAHLGAYTHREA